MRIEQLEYVTAVTRLGSFRRAAAELHISQPALSETVRNLERELGVEILERRRSGTTISDAGRDLLPHMVRVLDAVDQLRRTADDQHRSGRVVRLGTVNAATVPIVMPAIRAFRDEHPATRVEVIAAQHAEIRQALLDGSIDLGIVNLLDGDDVPPEIESTVLLRSHPVVCLRSDNRLAARDEVTVDELLGEPLITMRTGYAMHRFAHRLLDGRMPAVSYAADGAEMGKLLVAEGLGVTILPRHSVVGDPLERNGTITHRPLAGDRTEVRLASERRRSDANRMAARDLQRLLVASATEPSPVAAD